MIKKFKYKLKIFKFKSKTYPLNIDNVTKGIIFTIFAKVFRRGLTSPPRFLMKS